MLYYWIDSVELDLIIYKIRHKCTIVFKYSDNFYDGTFFITYRTFVQNLMESQFKPYIVVLDAAHFNICFHLISIYHSTDITD